ncbi:YcnI family protein [Devosia sp. RR2S18]|uniref:YcnI family copper-binding membrane protein n=1 Tax=Devosia rhizosphaerae TaxID=3049774 RepID=UPI0025425D3E|nr:DUF1775 domain-containing protein [Devosia sp. RR2S18]WIJ26899.1 DUF1775 domain-containing protein [Devosia sp. RR2S18]
MEKTVVLTAIALTLGSVPAQAHIVLQSKEAQLGASYPAVLVVGHGCGGEAPTRVSCPDPGRTLQSYARPMPKAGWDIETVAGPYETPFMNHGTELTEGVKEISWTGGSLPDDFFDEFTFRGTFAENPEEGTTFYFSVIQTCGSDEDAWIDQSGNEDVEFPAPAVTLKAGSGHHH